MRSYKHDLPTFKGYLRSKILYLPSIMLPLAIAIITFFLCKPSVWVHGAWVLPSSCNPLASYGSTRLQLSIDYGASMCACLRNLCTRMRANILWLVFCVANTSPPQLRHQKGGGWSLFGNEVERA